MRYVASEKLEIIRLIEESHLSARLTLAKLGIPRTTFYRWYDRYLQRGEAGLQDQSPKPRHVSTNDAVGVFDRAALPWRMRVAEECLDASLTLERLVLGKLAPVIKGH